MRSSATSHDTACARFATCLAGFPVDDRRVRSYAIDALLDTMGAALAGSTAPESRHLRKAIGPAASGEAGVWATSLRLPVAQAALVNGTAAHALEVDDFGGCGHSGAVVVPAALAAAARRDVSGADLVAAIIVGYEAAARATDALGGYPAHNAAGWHSTGTAGVFGAAAAAGRVLGLDEADLTHALALAGAYAGSTWSFLADGAMNKRLHAGKAAEAGLLAALLAQSGFTGPTHLFDPVWGGYLALYGGHAADYDALSQVHAEPLIFRSGFKPYACCRGCHSSLDVVLSLRAEHGLDDAAVERVEIVGSDQTVRQLGKQTVETMLDAQMSLPYSVAVALRHGSGALSYYQPPFLFDPALRDLAARVVVRAGPPDVGGEPEVHLHLRDGRHLSGRVAVARGAASNPLGRAELEEKFSVLAAMALPAERTAALGAFVAEIERQPGLGPLLALLSGAVGTETS
jgi:2-methylcitrate dehydratase PrpD